MTTIKSTSSSRATSCSAAARVVASANAANVMASMVQRADAPGGVVVIGGTAVVA